MLATQLLLFRHNYCLGLGYEKNLKQYVVFTGDLNINSADLQTLLTQSPLFSQIKPGPLTAAVQASGLR